MRIGNRLVRWLGSFVLAAGFLPLPLMAQEMPSRMLEGPAAASVTLRSVGAPTVDVRIAPSSKQLVEAAESASFRDGAVPPLAKALGIKPPPRPSSPRRVGSVFPSNAASQSVQWEQQADGGHATHIRITSTGALGIRAKLQLPAGMTMGEIRVVAKPGDIAETLPLRVAQLGEIWTPYTDGETQIVEIYTPQQVIGSQIRVVDIVHFEESLNAATGPGQASINAASAGTCSPDVVCTSNNSAIDAAIVERIKSVARLSFQSGGGSYVCTATLINSNALQNFLLTANHCISTQAEATSISTLWFYESTTCGGGTAAASPNRVDVSGGAQLVFTNQFVDQTLLRLNLSPPPGAIFSGWNAASLLAGSSIVSISHPAGDVKKFALGTVSSIQDRTDGLIRVADYEQEMYAILFSRGVIEQGSSGSGLFVLANGSLQLRGVLSNSTTRNDPNGMSCSNSTENANYGRFDYFYPQIAPLLNGLSYPTDDHPNQPSLSSPAIALGATANGSLGYLGDIDVFRIPVAQTGTLFVKSAGGYDLIGNLMDANGSTLLTNDDNFDGNNEFGIAWQVSPGNYYLAVAAYDPEVVTASGYSISTSFTTATTNHTAMWWGGDAQSGWGVNVNQQGNQIFATMFNYEAAGMGTQNPGLWLVSSGTRVGGADSFSGRLLRVNGPAFNASPFTPISTTNVTDVGKMDFDFTSANTGTLTYTITAPGTGAPAGTVVSKSISRQAFATLPVCEFTGSDRSFAFNYQDLWWNPNESGWGINFTHQSDTIFATLFTYEPGVGIFNRGMWLTATMSKQTGVQTFQGDLLRVTGSAFNANPFIPLNPATNVTRVGNMRVEFTTGNSAQLIYDVNGQPVTKAIERQVFDPFRPECKKP